MALYDCPNGSTVTVGAATVRGSARGRAGLE
jgi:hypothetical protein